MQKVQKSVKALLKECGKNWIGKAYIRDSLGACPRRSAKGAKLGKKGYLASYALLGDKR